MIVGLRKRSSSYRQRGQLSFHFDLEAFPESPGPDESICPPRSGAGFRWGVVNRDLVLEPKGRAFVTILKLGAPMAMIPVVVWCCAINRFYRLNRHKQ